MLREYPRRYEIENTGNQMRRREMLRAQQQKWLDGAVKQIAPPGKRVLILAGNYVTKWQGPKQKILWGFQFIPQKALYFRLLAMPNVTVYVVDEYGTSYTCSECGGQCQNLKKHKKRETRENSSRRRCGTSNPKELTDIWGLIRCTCCGMSWSRDRNACWNIAAKGYADLWPDEHPPEQLWAGLNPKPDDLRRFRDRTPDVEDRTAKRESGQYDDTEGPESP